MTETVARRLGPAGRDALQLLGSCPRIPTDVAFQLLGHGHVGSTRQVLARIRAMGLAQVETVAPGALLGSGTVRLWSLTPVGRRVLAELGEVPPPMHLVELPGAAAGRPRDPARQSVPTLVAAYRALGVLAATMKTRPQLRAWEQPWVRSIDTHDHDYARHVRLPAAALLETATSGIAPVLLLPDVGTSPVASHRTVLNRILALRRLAAEKQEPLLVVVTRGERPPHNRIVAWEELLRRVAARNGEPPLRASILAWPESDGRWSGSRDIRHARQIDYVLGLVARHPLLTPDQLAGLLDTTRSRVARLVESLVARGWLCQIDARHCGVNTDAFHRDTTSISLVELTRAGRREAAGRLLLSGAQAERHHGLLGGRARERRRWLRYLSHTIGTNGVFVGLAQAGRALTRSGGDDALIEWRSASACSRGGCRPDGFGVYRREQARYGFFLEYDRGTERAREYAAKLEAYYRYRDSGAAARDYAGFPTVLVVTTRAAAETRFAHEAYLAWQRRGGNPLRLLLTTTTLIEQSRLGVLGPIWRTAGTATLAESVRGYWLPGGSPRGWWAMAGKNEDANRGADFYPMVSDGLLRTGSITVRRDTITLGRGEPP